MKFLRRLFCVRAWNLQLLAENERLRERLRVYVERDQEIISMMDRYLDLRHLSRRTYIQ